jgi:hypothetical protein
MRRPSLTLRSGRSQLVDASASPVATNTLATLLHRAQQWLEARERLIAAWFTHFPLRIAPKMLERKRGGAGAILLPFWWEYESELKRRLALEAVLRRLFSMVPEPEIAPV